MVLRAGGVSVFSVILYIDKQGLRRFNVGFFPKRGVYTREKACKLFVGGQPGGWHANLSCLEVLIMVRGGNQPRQKMLAGTKPPAQRCRQVLCVCPVCGWRMRASRLWISRGLPKCVCGEVFIEGTRKVLRALERAQLQRFKGEAGYERA